MGQLGGSKRSSLQKNVNANSWQQIIDALNAHRELTEEQMRAALADMMHGRCGEEEAAAFLSGLRNKGETAQEIATAAAVLRQHMLRFEPGCDVLDTCGTGGDGAGTFNISTAAALVAAGAGAKIVKHGNRSVSGKCGSADVLAALGVNIEASAEVARAQLERAGLGFCLAPRFHPALSHVAAVRRRLGVPTIFNYVGPLANPAGAQRQLLGVGRLDLLERMAQALARLGTTRALLVCSRDGLDEVSLSAPTAVCDVAGPNVRQYEWTAADFGLEGVALADLAAADAGASAALIEQVLDGHDGPATRVVLANAAAALVAAELVDTPREGVVRARNALSSGKARKVLVELRNLNPGG
jgi:anthranilate phosphoribosyltransferase